MFRPTSSHFPRMRFLFPGTRLPVANVLHRTGNSQFCVTRWSLGYVAIMSKVWFSNSCYQLNSWAFEIVFITWTNFDEVLFMMTMWCHQGVSIKLVSNGVKPTPCQFNTGSTNSDPFSYFCPRISNARVTLTYVCTDHCHGGDIFDEIIGELL